MAREHGVRVTRLQHLARADCLRARAGAGAGAQRSRRVHRGRLPERHRRLRRVRLGRHARARRACPTTRRSASVIDRVLTDDGRGLLHFIGRNRPAPLNPWIDEAHLPGRLSADAASRCSSGSSSRAASRCSTSRTCGCTTPRRSSTGAQRFLGASRPRDARCSTTRSCAPGGLYLAGSRGRVQHRLAAAVPGGVRARRHQRDSLDARQRLRQARPTDGDLRRPGRRRRAGRIHVRVDAAQAGADVLVIDQATFPRDKVCAGWITPPVVDDARARHEAYAAGRTFQPITGFRDRRDRRRARRAQRATTQPVSLRHPPLRVRRLPAAALGALGFGWARRSRR